MIAQQEPPYVSDMGSAGLLRVPRTPSHPSTSEATSSRMTESKTCHAELYENAPPQPSCERISVEPTPTTGPQPLPSSYYTTLVLDVSYILRNPRKPHATNTVPSSDAKSKPPMKKRPLISQALAHLALNDADQELAFTLIATAWLGSYLETCNKKDNPSLSMAVQRLRALLPPGPSLLMALVGGAGYGKSTVIDAVHDYIAAWDAKHTLSITATTGIAAASIGGLTWQSALGGSFAAVDAEVSPVEQSVWSRITVLIIDEISMAGCHQLHRIDRRLRALKMRPDVPFGGVHVIFAGDFVQLPAVRATQLYHGTCYFLQFSPLCVRSAKWIRFSVSIWPL